MKKTKKFESLQELYKYLEGGWQEILQEQARQKIKFYPDSIDEVQFWNNFEESRKFFNGGKAKTIIGGKMVTIWVDPTKTYEYKE